MAAVLSLVEPVLLVLMAVIVAAMLLAFYLPMFQAISAVQGTVR
jgi:type II secretory pathway component PulF